MFLTWAKEVAQCRKIRVSDLKYFFFLFLSLCLKHSSSEKSHFLGVPHQHAAEGSVCVCCPQDSEPSNEVVSEAPGNVVPSTSRSGSEELIAVAQKRPEEVGHSVSIFSKINWWGIHICLCSSMLSVVLLITETF